MKLVILSIVFILFSFGTFASNKICVGEKVVVVLNEKLKKLIVIDKETMEILQSTELEGENFGEIALSQNGSKIWFQVDEMMNCRDIETGEMTMQLEGRGNYKFELSAAQDYLIHYEKVDGSSLIYVYDLNIAEAVSYAKVDFTNHLETAHYDSKKQQIHLISETFQSKTEKRLKEPNIGFPESAEQISLIFMYDQSEVRYFVYDIENKKAIYDEILNYSPASSFDFEVISDHLYIITDIGTAEVLEDFSLKIIPLDLINKSDYAIFESEIIAPTGFDLVLNSFETGKQKKMNDREANIIFIEADAIAMTESYYYCIKNEIFYRVQRSEPMNSDFEMPLD